MKKIFSLFLSAVMLISVFGIVPMTAEASLDNEYSNYYITNVEANYDSNYAFNIDWLSYDYDDDRYYFQYYPFDEGDSITVTYYGKKKSGSYQTFKRTYEYYYDDDDDDEYFVDTKDNENVIYPRFYINYGDIFYFDKEAYVIVGVYDDYYDEYEEDACYCNFVCYHNGSTYYNVDYPATTDSDGHWSNRCSECYEALNGGAIPRISTISLSQTEYTFNGYQKTPTVTVKDRLGNKLVNGIDYDVVYPSGRVNVGEYKVWVKFKGDYAKSDYRIFDIFPTDTKITKKSGVKKGFKITWKRSYQVDGYQIQYSLKKNFSGAKTVYASANATTKTVKKLKRKKNYYVRIRGYKSASGYTYYTGWKTAKVKTK